LDPLSALAAVLVGGCLDHLGRFEEGLVWFERAIEIDPSFSFGYGRIAGYYAFSLGRLDESVVWGRKAISLDPGDVPRFAFHGWNLLNLGGLDEAEYWINRSIELGSESWGPNFSMQLLHLYRGDEATALEYGYKALAIYPFDWPVFALLRDHDLRAGQYVEARTSFEESYPDLLNDDNPEIGISNYWIAINLAAVLSQTGEQQRADLLLDRSLKVIQSMPRLGAGGRLVSDVQIYALQGEKQKALSALRQAIDEGWRDLWWYYLKQDPSLESLHDEPEFQAMVAEIETDMAAQLARVREMERNGELEPIPEVSATIQ
jgi:tetratricopeptide (TPR) repeat protein